MGGTATTPNIPGLPPGAQVKPLGANPNPTLAANVNNLPPGAQVKPLGVSSPAPQPAPTQQEPQGGGVEDPGVASGMWETTLGPIWENAKAEYKEQARISQEPFLQSLKDRFAKVATENPAMGGGLKMLWGVANDAYEQGKKSMQGIGRAAKGEMEAGKRLVSGDLRGAGEAGRQAQNEMTEATGHGLAAMLPVLGPMAAKAGEDIGAGKTGEGIGEGLGTILNVVIGSKVVGKKAVGARTAEALDEAAAARQLTDAINPHPGTVQNNLRAELRTNLEAEVPRLKQYAEQAGIPLDTRTGLLKTARQAGEEYQALYDKQLAEPIKDEVMSSGQTFGEAEARLRHLNRTTSYQPSSSAETEIQVARKAEAARLRTALNNEMPAKLGGGITPEQISEARSIGERMQAIADHVEYGMDVEQFGKQSAGRGAVANVHATPHGVYATSGRAGAALNRGVEKMFGNPADKAVRDVFQKYTPAPAKAPAPNVADARAAEAEKKFATRPEPRVPAYKKENAPGSTPVGSTSSIGEQIQAKEAAARQRTAERAAENAKTKQTREAAARAQVEKNRKAHPKYKAAANALEE